MRHLAVLGLFLLVGWGGRTASAWAASPQPLQAALYLEEDRVVANFDVTAALDAEFLRRVNGGLESRVEIATQLVDRNQNILGRGLRSCKLLYSLWDEKVFVSLTDDGRGPAQVLVFGEVEPAVRACTMVRRLPVAHGGTLALADGYRLEARVILNPVSEELIERSRQFITNPRGGARGRSNAVLGAVAGLLFSPEGGALGTISAFASRPLLRPTQAGPASRSPPVAKTSTTADNAITATASSPTERVP